MAFNLGQGSLGALGGAGTGATLGSFGGPIGTGIGAGVGGLIGLLSGGFGGNNEQLFGKKQQYKEMQSFTPQQTNYLNQLLSQSSQGLQNPYAGFDPIAEQAQSKFQRDIIPGLAERFTAMGGSGTRSSSDFGGTLGGAASDLQQGLASLRAQYGLQNREGLLRQGQLGLTPQFERINEPETYGFGGNLLYALLSNPELGKVLGQLMGSRLGVTANQQQTGA